MIPRRPPMHQGKEGQTQSMPQAHNPGVFSMGGKPPDAFRPNFTGQAWANPLTDRGAHRQCDL